MRYFLSSPRRATMRFTRPTFLRNAFHTHPHTVRTEGAVSNVREITHRARHQLWDNTPGVPYNNSYLIRVLETMISPRYADYPAVTERLDYGTQDSISYSYRKLGTDMYETRKALLKVDVIDETLSAFEARRGFSIGLVADRSYEFVVNLLTLLSIGVRPVLISNTAKPLEIHNLMQTAKTAFLIPPSKFPASQPWFESFKKEHPEYKIWANEELESRRDSRPLSEKELAQEYTLTTSLQKQGTILFTSGTTGNPKAVFTDMSSIAQQCTALRNLWEYTEDDRLLHVLPNHHIHGLVNCLLTPLSSGSAVEFVTSPFNPHKVLNRIAEPPSVDFPPITMFHGVPTMYSSLLTAYDSYDTPTKQRVARGLQSLRVAISGSAALPVPIAKKWEEITGTIPLERYGMTETGMVFSNSLDPSLRKIGSVGYPMLGVHAHLLDPNDRILMVANVPGKLVVRWHAESQLFHKYWNDIKATNRARVKPEQVATRAIDKIENGKVMMKTMKLKRNAKPVRQKVKDHWFRTGDMAVRGEDGEYYMLGRESVDIMKVAGHLISALEIEREILSLPEISETAVVAVPSSKFGSLPHAIIALKPEYSQQLTSKPNYKNELISSLRKEMREKLSPEKLPRRWIIVDSIPRNAMGKVNKKTLLADESLFPKRESDTTAAETGEENLELEPPSAAEMSNNAENVDELIEQEEELQPEEEGGKETEVERKEQ
ncbi:hypothetical protein TWF481_009689 [Arthrobotrys musiformis]|uniref:Acetyl-CoA synthetase-like protein n=1 Tax=Arthrobotrys musiformis TaxID=47236 RepID=A0AAV9W4J1_9PEZI